MQDSVLWAVQVLRARIKPHGESYMVERTYGWRSQAFCFLELHWRNRMGQVLIHDPASSQSYLTPHKFGPKLAIKRSKTKNVTLFLMTKFLKEKYIYISFWLVWAKFLALLCAGFGPLLGFRLNGPVPDLCYIIHGPKVWEGQNPFIMCCILIIWSSHLCAD